MEAAATELTAWAGLGPGCKAVVYAETKADWQVAAQACFRQSATVVTIYATLGEEGVSHGLNLIKGSLVVRCPVGLRSGPSLWPRSVALPCGAAVRRCSVALPCGAAVWCCRVALLLGAAA